MIWRFFMSLRGQIILLLLGVLLAAQIVALLFFVDERSLAVRAALGFEATGRAASVTRLLEEAPSDLHAAILRAANSPLVRFEMTDEPVIETSNERDSGPVEARIRALLDDPFTREIRVDVHEVEGTIMPLPHLSSGLANFRSTVTGNDMSTMMGNDMSAMMGNDMSALEMSISVALLGGGWLNVQTRFERPPLQWALGSTITFVLTAAGLLAAGFWFLMARITGPLRDLAVASERLGRGEEMEPVEPTGPTEVRDLTAAFGIMQERLTRFVEDRTRMLAAIGHDLRSPLTALRVRTEMVDDEETRDHMVASIAEMQGMLDATLSYARGVSASEPSERVEIGEVLTNINQAMPTQFALAPGPQLAISVRPFAFRRALRNLIENAQRYGGGAQVTFEEQDGVAVIEVADQGPGIPEDQLEEVFAPFQRLDRSRSLDTGGHGLGLSIARSILRAHGGDVTLANAPGGGLVAHVTLPINAITDPDADQQGTSLADSAPFNDYQPASRANS
jgi:signal transduction histidine kinase